MMSNKSLCTHTWHIGCAANENVWGLHVLQLQGLMPREGEGQVEGAGSWRDYQGGLCSGPVSYKQLKQTRLVMLSLQEDITLKLPFIT